MLTRQNIFMSLRMAMERRNKKNFREDAALYDMLSEHLDGWDARYGLDTRDRPIEERFRLLIVKANEVTDRRAEKQMRSLLRNPGFAVIL